MTEDASGRESASTPQEKTRNLLARVPGQIWFVVIVLVIAGLATDLPSIRTAPIAASWLAAKILFIIGLIRRWRWVFVVFLIDGVVHVVAFAQEIPPLALVNLLLVVLVASAFRFYFPKKQSIQQISEPTH